MNRNNLPSLTLPDLDALAAVAEAAARDCPGRWYWSTSNSHRYLKSGEAGCIARGLTTSDGVDDIAIAERAMQHIAALSPPFALALIALARNGLTLRTALEELLRAVDACDEIERGGYTIARADKAKVDALAAAHAALARSR